MKGKVKIFLVATLAITILASITLNSAAAEVNVLNADFENGIAFTAMGDLDVDGKIASSDMVILRKMIFSDNFDAGKKYADVNEDSNVDIIDIVRLKKNLLADKKPVSVVDGVLMLNGKAYYTQELLSLMKPNTEYQITYKVESEDGITISIDGAKNATAVYNSGKGTKRFSHILKTGNSLTENEGLEMVVSGIGKIDDIKINEITTGWFDGDTAEQGSNDIF